jgi:acyl-homoserine-lactone acylase
MTIGYEGASKPRFAALSIALVTLMSSHAVFGFRESASSQGAAGSQVTIYRDDWGVPHIYAAAEEAGFYGLGYAQAEDHLEGVLRMILTVRGEQAAAFGPEFADADLGQRQWMQMEEARAGFERLSPQLQKNYRYFMAGIRHFMDEHPKEVPSWSPQLEPAALIAWPRSALWGYYVGDGLQDCTRGGASLTATSQSILDLKTPNASNEWIVAPWRTSDNAMIVLSDPHGPVDGSFVYEFRMDAGAIKSAGYSIGAQMTLVHTRNISWGMTTGAPDTSDCYEVAVDPNNPRRYQFDGEWKTMTTREVTINVKGGAPITRTFEYTHHNGALCPVVARKEDKAYVVSSPYFGHAGDQDQELYEMNLAKNAAEARNAMKRLGMFSQNVMIGDSHGNSFYVRAGRTPKRPAGYDWSKPVPGNTSKTAWTGVHPLEDLVQIENPSTGYMTNNNIAPDMMMEKSPLSADRYPAYIFNDQRGRTNTRGMRVVEVLSKAYNFTVSDAIELSLDEKWVGTESWQRALATAATQNVAAVRDKPPEFRRFLDRLLRFDGMARAGSVSALDYFYWQNAVWADPEILNTPLDSLNRMLSSEGQVTPDFGKALIKAIDTAVSAITKDHGSIDLELGDVFRIGRGGYSWPLGGIGIIPPGRAACKTAIGWDQHCLATLRAMIPGKPDERRQRWPVIGSRLLRLVVFTNPIQSFTLHNFGQSGRTDSPHYSDQARLTSERRLKPVYFEKTEILRHAVSTKNLEVVIH